MKPEIVKDHGKVMSRIAANLKRLRKRAGLSQEDMISHDFHLRAYQRLEAGEGNPTILTLLRIAKAFECDVKELLK